MPSTVTIDSKPQEAGMATLIGGKPTAPVPRRARHDIRCLGHRGVAATYPENTLPSFVAALDAGADGIELDIRLTRDDEVIVMHDPTLDRTTDHEGLVSHYTWAELQHVRARPTFLGYPACFGKPSPTTTSNPSASLQETDPPSTLLGRKKKPHATKKASPAAAAKNATAAASDARPSGPDAPIPRLVDALDLVLHHPNPALTVIIDIKWDNPLAIMSHVRAILAMPCYRPLLPRITLGIWSPHFLWSLPSLNVLPVRRSFIGSSLWLARLFYGWVDNFSIDARVLQANPGWVHDRQRAGYTVTAWTVDGPADVDRLLALGVDNIISDHVGQALAVRDGTALPLPEHDFMPVGAAAVEQVVVATATVGAAPSASAPTPAPAPAQEESSALPPMAAAQVMVAAAAAAAAAAAVATVAAAEPAAAAAPVADVTSTAPPATPLVEGMAVA